MAQMNSAYVLTAAGKPLEKRSLAEPSPDDGQVLVEVEACGLCHTDLAYASGEVAPRHPCRSCSDTRSSVASSRAGAKHRRSSASACSCPPSSRAKTATSAAPAGATPAPAKRCPATTSTAASRRHVLVPGGPLVPLDDVPASVDARHLSVVADAVSTAYQAIRPRRAARGTWRSSSARAAWAATPSRSRARSAPASSRSTSAPPSSRWWPLTAPRRPCTSRAARRRRCARRCTASPPSGASPRSAFRIFECSGTPQGQTLAFALLAPAATMVQVGYCAATVEVRLSNLMAFDATIHGTWGCPPGAVSRGAAPHLLGGGGPRPFVEHAPMSRVNELLDDMAHHRLGRRIVFDPRT